MKKLLLAIALLQAPTFSNSTTKKPPRINHQNCPISQIFGCCDCPDGEPISASKKPTPKNYLQATLQRMPDDFRE